MITKPIIDDITDILRDQAMVILMDRIRRRYVAREIINKVVKQIKVENRRIFEL
jgi:hypothetical protein